MRLTGQANFAVETHTIDVDTDGDGNSDLLGAELRTIAFEIPAGNPVSLVVTGIGNLTVSGNLGVAQITPRDQSAARYTALRMGDVVVTGGLDAGLEDDFGANATITLTGLDVNLAATGFDRLNWSRAFDFDGDGVQDLVDPTGMQPIDYSSSLDFRFSGEVTDLDLQFGEVHITVLPPSPPRGATLM